MRTLRFANVAAALSDDSDSDHAAHVLDLPCILESASLRDVRKCANARAQAFRVDMFSKQQSAQDFSLRSAVKPMPRRFGGGGFISSRMAESMAAIASS